MREVIDFRRQSFRISRNVICKSIWIQFHTCSQKKNLLKKYKEILAIFDPFIAFRQQNCNKTSLKNVDLNIDFTLNWRMWNLMMKRKAEKYILSIYFLWISFLWKLWINPLSSFHICRHRRRMMILELKGIYQIPHSHLTPHLLPRSRLALITIWKMLENW